jgi:hypothetical protein
MSSPDLRNDLPENLHSPQESQSLRNEAVGAMTEELKPEFESLGNAVETQTKEYAIILKGCFPNCDFDQQHRDIFKKLVKDIFPNRPVPK